MIRLLLTWWGRYSNRPHRVLSECGAAIVDDSIHPCIREDSHLGPHIALVSGALITWDQTIGRFPTDPRRKVKI